MYWLNASNIATRWKQGIIDLKGLCKDVSRECLDLLLKKLEMFITELQMDAKHLNDIVSIMNNLQN
ncbi:hypothetical protein AGJ35_05880 [Cronobacter dublinensis subsp. dublinensis]|nr:hypothetical protein [Cronobacter dublinensis subsp. dublinensis]EGT5735427.1 hypothetical protein [Cronobacter dublinensis subsp. dublinensis]